MIEKTPTGAALDKLIIVDDFYSDPETIRQKALNSEYHVPPNNTDRLAKTTECSEYDTRFMCELLQPYIERHHDVAGVAVLFRYTLANTQKKAHCHVDGSSFAGIVYLTQPEHCAGGTSIFRHKPTGDEIFNPLHKHMYDFLDESQWELVKEVEMVYNRLVMYPGQLFHSITPIFFGDNITNARLTQNIFIYYPGDPALKKKNNRI